MQQSTEPLSATRRLGVFALLMVAEFFYSWAWNTVDVLRPYLRSSLGLSLVQVGSGYSAQGAGALVGAILIGQWADRAGRRRVLPAVMIGYGVALLAGVIITNYAEFLTQRFILGIFLGGVFPVVVGVYADLFGQHVRGRLASVLNAIFSGAIVLLGVAAARIAPESWRLLFWMGGVPPVVLSLLAWAIIPNQRIMARTDTRLPVAQLFATDVRRQTVLLAMLVGLNFFAYQAFSGWLTTYLAEVKHFTPAAAGVTVAYQFSGNILGCFAWGFIGDRWGRKMNAWGFIASAAAIFLFLTTATSGHVIEAIGFVYGFGLSCTVIWGPWLAELYPEHLRSTAVAIFHYGRVVSFFAPLITAAVAGAFGLTSAMMLASGTFIVAAAIWSLLPETLRKSRTSAVVSEATG